MNLARIRRVLLASLSGIAISLGAVSMNVAYAQGHDRTTGSGHDSSSSGHDSSDSGHSDSEKGGKGRGGRDAGAAGSGSGRGSLRDVFREMEADAAASDESRHGEGEEADSGRGQKGKPSETGRKAAESPRQGGQDTAAKGRKPADHTTAEGEEEDSDRPEWAGTSGPDSKPGRPNQSSGTKKGTIYGDLYIIVRDENGVPVPDEDGYVQVYYVNADGELTCCILRDAEGNLLPTLEDGTSVLPIEVELGRLSVGRSPTSVLAAQYDEAINSINDAVSVAFDPSGRIVLTLEDGTTKTIDSPLENLALYVELLNTGTLTDVSADKLASLGISDDGTVTATELAIAASFFAAASDKSIEISIDAIEYMNAILRIDGTLPDDFVNYSSFTYDREAVYDGVMITVLVEDTDGVWKEMEVNLYEAVFDSTETGELTNVEAFTQAADDARAIIDFIHLYGIPTE